eukprot:29225-Pelagococcus_subviridis.AAC.5
MPHVPGVRFLLRGGRQHAIESVAIEFDADAPQRRHEPVVHGAVRRRRRQRVAIVVRVRVVREGVPAKIFSRRRRRRRRPFVPERAHGFV